MKNVSKHDASWKVISAHEPNPILMVIMTTEEAHTAYTVVLFQYFRIKIENTEEYLQPKQ